MVCGITAASTTGSAKEPSANTRASASPAVTVTAQSATAATTLIRVAFMTSSRPRRGRPAGPRQHGLVPRRREAPSRIDDRHGEAAGTARACAGADEHERRTRGAERTEQLELLRRQRADDRDQQP